MSTAQTTPATKPAKAIKPAPQTVIPAEAPRLAVTEYPFLLVSIPKLVIMSVLTLNLYNIYWGYKNWQAVQQTENVNIHPKLRALFPVFFIRSLARRMGVTQPTKVVLTLIGIALFTRLNNSLSLLSVLSFVPFIWMQQAVNAHHPADKLSNAYSTTEKVLVVVGALLWVLVFIGLTVPE